MTEGFSRAELAAALDHYQATVRRAQADADWAQFADLFTEDADYNEHAFGRLRGRPAIAEWVVRTMTSFPGNAMVAFPVSWSVVDPERGWIVCEIQNVMRDPGDGSLHESPNLTILHYAGAGRFRYEEDVYNPARFVAMVAGWAGVARARGRLPTDADDWLRRYASGTA